MLFASPEKRLTFQANDLAEKVKQEFNSLAQVIKRGEHVIADHEKVTADRENFLRDNEDMQIDQNVSTNTDTKRAKWLLVGVVLICLIFSVKGLSFLFGAFYATISLWVVLPIAILLAAFIVMGSIYLNHFAEQRRGASVVEFIVGKIAAYSIILFLPVLNLMEGFDSQYQEVVMTLNILACVVDVIAHCALVTMSHVFVTAEDSRKAISILRKKDRAQKRADQRLRSLNAEFTTIKNRFSNVTTRFVQVYSQLHEVDERAAANMMFLLPNFIIWMINNRIVQHAVLPYHADEAGRPVVDLQYFTPDNDSIRQGWDQLSSVNGYSTMNETLQIQEDREDEGAAHNGQEEHRNQNGTSVNGTRSQSNGTMTIDDRSEEQPTLPELATYEDLFDETDPNPNDKYL